MYISLKGKAERAFVPEVWLDGVPAAQLWYEGRQLYPDERTRVKDIVLGFKEGTERAYWVHAVDAVQGGASEGCFMRMRFKGREWMLYSTFDGLPCLRAVNGMLRFAADDGILLQDCVGARVQVDVVVPERRGKGLRSALRNAPGYVEDKLWDLPLLPGTRIVLEGYKGQKREWAYWNNVSVVGVPSGRVYVQGWQTRATQYGRGAVIKDVAKLSEVDLSDEGWRGTANLYGSAGWFDGLVPVYPAFSMSWEVPILGVTLQVE